MSEIPAPIRRAGFEEGIIYLCRISMDSNLACLGKRSLIGSKKEGKGLLGF